MRIFVNKRVFLKMILSYILILIIPLVFGISLYFSTINMYRKDVDEANLQVLNNVKDNINTNLSGMSNMMQALLSESNVIALSTKADYINFDYMNMNNLQKKLQMSLLSNNYIDEILVYFHQSDFLLTSKDYLNHTEKMTGFSTTIGLSVHAFSNQLSQDNLFKSVVLDEGKGKKVFLRASDSNGNRGYTPNTTIMVRLKTDLLSKLMLSESCKTFFVDAHGGYISPENATLLGSEKGDWSLNKPKRENSVIQNSDELFGIRYVRFIPNEIYFKNLSSLQLLAMTFVLLCLVIGVPLAISVAKKNYNPIKEILALIPYSSEGRELDDYKVISNSICDLLNRSKKNEAEQNIRLPAMRNYIFYRAIEDSTFNEKNFFAECKKSSVEFEYTCFLLISFAIENGSNLFFKEDENASGEMSQLLFIAITNILREIVGEEYKLFTAEYKGKCYAILNINNRLDKDVVIEEIKNYCEQLNFRLDNDFRAIVSIGISGIHSGLLGIGDCYSELMKVGSKQNHYKRSAYVAQYDELFSEEKNLQSRNDDDERDATQEKRNKRSYSIHAICKYIDANYSNADLTVAAISEKFDMTTANLSLYFKRKKGVSPLEYIQIKRVGEAKKLLDSTELKIFDIAKSVGYFDTRPLNRSFKRIEGTTPAEYRVLPKQEEQGNAKE